MTTNELGKAQKKRQLVMQVHFVFELERKWREFFKWLTKLYRKY